MYAHTVKYKNTEQVANTVQIVCGERKREGFWKKKNNIEQKAIFM